MAPNIWNGQTRKMQPVVEMVQINLIKLSSCPMVKWEKMVQLMKVTEPDKM